MLFDAIALTGSDLIAGVGFALVIATLVLIARGMRDAEPGDFEAEPEVIEAFSQFPDPWRPEAHSRIDDSDRRAA